MKANISIDKVLYRLRKRLKEAKADERRQAKGRLYKAAIMSVQEQATIQAMINWMKLEKRPTIKPKRK